MASMASRSWLCASSLISMGLPSIASRSLPSISLAPGGNGKGSMTRARTIRSPRPKPSRCGMPWPSSRNTRPCCVSGGYGEHQVPAVGSLDGDLTAHQSRRQVHVGVALEVVALALEARVGLQAHGEKQVARLAWSRRGQPAARCGCACRSRCRAVSSPRCGATGRRDPCPSTRRTGRPRRWRRGRRSAGTADPAPPAPAPHRPSTPPRTARQSSAR